MVAAERSRSDLQANVKYRSKLSKYQLRGNMVKELDSELRNIYSVNPPTVRLTAL